MPLTADEIVRGLGQPTDCQREPHYPGLPTVTFSIRYPEMTCHHATARCAIEAPHAIAECGEWRDVA